MASISTMSILKKTVASRWLIISGQLSPIMCRMMARSGFWATFLTSGRASQASAAKVTRLVTTAPPASPTTPQPSSSVASPIVTLTMVLTVVIAAGYSAFSNA